MNKTLDLSGQRYSRLTAVKRAPNSKTDNTTRWVCKCDCGKVVTVYTRSLRGETTRSCGCLRGTHRLSKTLEHGIWASMISRTTNPNAYAYELYGGRGIKVCNRWLKFENFYKDMGPRPNKKLSIDRIDNEKGYSPDNCKWETSINQNRNTRRNVHITIDGVTKLLVEWKKISPVHSATYHYRKRRGDSDRDALGL